MSTKQNPKLDRRNAAKNIDYDTSNDGSSQSIPDQTSFRINREFELICRSLGLSGPEDFLISAAASVHTSTIFHIPAHKKQVGEFNDVALAPPPVRSSAVVVDNFGSNWELIRGFATIDEDEVSSNADEVEFSVSTRNGSLKYNTTSTSIKNWQKGDFLGKGSYGTVYEAFTE